MNKKIKMKTKGFSLIELLLVLGIIAALAITAFFVFPKVKAGMEAQQIIDTANSAYAQLTMLRQGQKTNTNELKEKDAISCIDVSDKECFKKYGLEDLNKSGSTARFIFSQIPGYGDDSISLMVVGMSNSIVCNKVATSLLNTHGDMMINGPFAFESFERGAERRSAIKKITEVCAGYNDPDWIENSGGELMYDGEANSIVIYTE